MLTGTASVTSLAALEAINGMASAIVFPAAAAMTPLTVPNVRLQEANAMLRLGLNAALIVGAASGGLLVGTLGSGWGLAVDAAAYVVAAGCLSRLQHTRDAGPAASHRQPGMTTMVSDLRDGWREVSSRTWLWAVVIAFGFANAAQAAARGTLGPVLADRSFGPEGWGLVLAAQTAGMFAGGFLMLRLRPSRPLLVGCAAILLWVPMFVVLAVSPTLPALLPVAFLGGIGIEVFSVCWDLSLQQQIPQDRLSRVYSFDALGSYAMIPSANFSPGH